ncbi:MAG: PhzF family phenazine biosynthesis protein [Salinibacterium sp.]|nr:PhzF family phenazine biosynthesis protein [Salinibacterium sp.]
MTEVDDQLLGRLEKVRVLRYAAFTDEGTGGNPAGVVLDAGDLDEDARLRIAARLGYSETAFVDEPRGATKFRLRYYSPLAEVAFCGHATIAAAVALADRHGPGRIKFTTLAGPIEVRTQPAAAGYAATLTSVPTHTRPATAEEVASALKSLRWSPDDIDSHYPPHIAFAGNDHLILAVRSRDRLANLDYDYDGLASLMAQRRWTTLQLVHAHTPLLFSSRNPFPPGGIVEDPATGAAAAALGGYLRALNLVDLPTRVTVMQGQDMGKPSRLLVDLSADDDRVQVTGTATALR